MAGSQPLGTVIAFVAAAVHAGSAVIAMPMPGHAVDGPPEPVLVLVLVVPPPPAPPSPVELELEPPPEPLVASPPQPESIEANETRINVPRALRMTDEGSRDPGKIAVKLRDFNLA